jgi:hypothetical protein
VSIQEIDLLVLGDCNPDLLVIGEQVEPEFGQVERLVDAAALTIGGSGSIVACGAARLGLRTAMVGVVGDDLFGRFMVDALGELGVDTCGIVSDPEARTGLTVILDRGHDRAMLTFPGTIAALSAGVLDSELLHRTRHVHISSFFLQSALAPSLSCSRRRRTPVRRRRSIQTGIRRNNGMVACTTCCAQRTSSCPMQRRRCESRIVRIPYRPRSSSPQQSLLWLSSSALRERSAHVVTAS